jgi:hypothetical protein
VVAQVEGASDIPGELVGRDVEVLESQAESVAISPVSLFPFKANAHALRHGHHQ